MSDPVAFGVNNDLSLGVDVAGIDIGQDLDVIELLSLPSDDDVR